MHRERYGRLIDKVERLELGGALEAFDMNVYQCIAFMKDGDKIDSHIDSIYRAYKFGMLQALRFASKHSREECAEIVRGVDQ